MFNNFSDLPISEETLQAVKDLGFKSPTEIQAKSIPFLCENEQDFIGIAQTGTGKTAAFLIPILEKLNYDKKQTQCLILAPTRELAQQIHTQLKDLCKHRPVTSTCVYGGAPIPPQIKALAKQPQIIVGTPGRVLDHMKRKRMKLESCDYFVLDEADEMLNMGFWEDIQIIFNSIKNLKQTLMFSATLPKAIQKHIDKNFSSDFKKVLVEKKSLSNVDIAQKYFVVKDKFFKQALLRIIEATPDIYSIIFCRTRIETKDVADFLRDNNLNIEVLNGDMGQKERTRAMDKFKEKKVNIMVCTDVAARGIDVNNLTHVINYGIPQDNETYVHRIGRTGRAGAQGIALTITCPKTAFVIKKIERHIRAKIEIQNLPKLETLKKNKIESELIKIKDWRDKLDDNSFETSGFTKFDQELQKCTRDEILKLFYKSHFEDKLEQFNKHKNIEVDVNKVDMSVHSNKKPSRRRGGGRRGRSGGNGRGRNGGGGGRGRRSRRS